MSRVFLYSRNHTMVNTIYLLLHRWEYEKPGAYTPGSLLCLFFLKPGGKENGGRNLWE